ncbi:MAG: response regulator [Actinomycetota bacterium]
MTTARGTSGATRVLLCDDTEDILLLLSMELGFHEDMEVVGAAHNGRQAIELAQRLQPDIVILDLAMPVMGGLEALPRILEVSPRTKVVVLSGLEDGNMAARALALGADRFLEKGLDPDEIATVVKEVAHTARGEATSVGVDLSSLVIVVAEGEVEGEADAERALEASLSASGAEVIAVSDDASALEVVGDARPDLVLLDTAAPELDAYELCRRLRSEPATGNIPVVMLVDRSIATDKVAEIALEASDYVIKPLDPVELQMRVTSALRTKQETTALSPLTYLPGNVQIERELKQRTGEGRLFALMYIDLDNFKAFNDYYGFLRGDEAIRLEATCTTDAVRRHARDGFVGHVGGDDVIALVDAGSAEAVARDVIDAWDRTILSLYDPEDAGRGYIEMTDRLGELRRYPISTISIGIATNEHRPLTNHWEASEIATEMKRFAKRRTGSGYAFDRRTAAERRSARGAPPAEGERRRRVIRLDR